MFYPCGMSQTLNGSGNGHNGHNLIHQLKKKVVQAQISASPNAAKENEVVFQTAEGITLRGALSRMTRHAAVFELYNPSITPRLSEALDEFKIVFQERTIYSGRAVVQSIVDAGTKVVCQATLNEAHWTDVDLNLVTQCDDRIVEEFSKFLGKWQNLYNVLPEYKDAVADIEIFLTNLRLWLEQIELGIRASPKHNQAQLERGLINKLSPRINPIINGLFERFEKIAAGLDEDMRPVHRNYIQRQLHPIVLCAPFADRAYQKPLGYPGDYEMVNMMARDPQEGASIFAKIFNVWLHQQGSALAHRNRLEDLAKRIEQETLRVSRTGGKTRIFNFACGPAIEVQHFLGNSLLSEKVEFTLADFNAETLEHTAKAIHIIKERLGRHTSVQFQKKTAHQLLKESQKSIVTGNGTKREYDFIYCAGLFDYLTDLACQQLIKIFYQWLAPGGLMYLTNVTPLTTNRGSLELILDWHLIYRNATEMGRLCSGIIPKEMVRVRSDETGINIFLEARKPTDD
jgi:extracellular factor (EF) 3-hydroxypalmitic acid methyl ester biosynthesis protein